MLEHDSRFTKGVILNRPTSYTRKGLNKEDEEWRVWYGGDVRGLNDKEPDQEVGLSNEAWRLLCCAVPCRVVLRYAVVCSAVRHGVAR